MDKNDSKSNTLNYLEEKNFNNSTINTEKSEDNNIISIKESKNSFQKDIENLESVKIENGINNQNKEEFVIPQDLKKTYRITILLSITGIILILCGIIKAVISNKFGGGLMFWILAILVLIPGGFYSYQFFRAKISKSQYERQEILDSLPRLQ